jgi:hypothetical protein
MDLPGIKTDCFGCDMGQIAHKIDQKFISVAHQASRGPVVEKVEEKAQ